MNAQTVFGALHAQELLLISLIRTLPPEGRRALADAFEEQIRFAETQAPAASRERDAHDAYLAHARNLLIRVESIA